MHQIAAGERRADLNAAWRRRGKDVAGRKMMVVQMPEMLLRRRKSIVRSFAKKFADELSYRFEFFDLPSLYCTVFTDHMGLYIFHGYFSGSRQ
ncbi:hypothetical protein NUH86_18705 [Sphingobium sp. JS3065]|uniref:hypothetical protein n=1 Tax=Sphingobium sp. JS3065 TaxID=2970925 RepID=UPI00226565AA|nr:hypothetical protein [Sphingobium sp. JS3065]UZW57606.1 hypothetical protein NUH86_18705 [Sphingobium sp. JS3065]